MKISGNYSYKKAIIITPDNLKELDKIIKKYYSDIRYIANTFSGNSIRFDSLNELLSYDNFAKERISELTIFGELDYDSTALCIYFKPALSLLFSYGATVEVSHKHKTMNKKTVFVDQIQTAIEKLGAPFYLTVLGKPSLLFWGLTSMLVSAIIGVLHPSNTRIYMSYSSIVLLIFAASLFVWILLKTIGPIWKSLFPPIVFLWGEETKRNGQISKWRSNLFWSALVALLIAIIAFFITKPFA